MKEKTIKDIIDNSRWHWYDEGDEAQTDNCYKGWFWDYTTKTFVKWNDLPSE